MAGTPPRPTVVDGHPVVSGTTVLVDGATASILADALAVLVRSAGGRPLNPRIEAAQQAFRLAGDRQEKVLNFRLRKVGSAPASDCVMVGEMTAAQAAEMLNITPRAVTYRAVALGGRKVGGRWLFDAADIDHASRPREDA